MYNLQMVKSTTFSVQCEKFDKCILSYNYHQHQDTEQFTYSPKFP